MNILQEIGLTEREAEIYKLLLKLGESPVSVILKNTGFHPQVVYRVIDNLVKKGLVIESTRRDRKYVQAESPRVLERLEQYRMEKLRIAIPELIELQASSKEAMVRVAKGDAAVRALRQRGIDELKSGATYSIIGGSGDRFYNVMGDRYAEIERKRIKKRITKRLISFEHERAKFAKDPYREHTEFRYLSDDFPIMTSTNIYGNTVAIIIWSSEPIVITIESYEVATSYKEYFQLLWRMAEV